MDASPGQQNENTKTKQQQIYQITYEKGDTVILKTKYFLFTYEIRHIPENNKRFYFT